MTDPIIPNIPVSLPNDQIDFFQSLKSGIEFMLGHGRNLDEERALRVRELENFGVTIRQFLNSSKTNPYPLSAPSVSSSESQATPEPPTNLTVLKKTFIHIVSWTTPTDEIISHIEVWVAENSQNRSNAILRHVVTITESLRGETTYYNKSVVNPTSDYTYWIRTVSYAGNHSEWEPTDAMGGHVVTGDAAVAETVDGIIELLQGTTPLLYAAGTTYAADDRCRTSDGRRWKSLSDGNVGHEPPNATYWKRIGILMTGDVDGVPTVAIDGNLVVDNTILAPAIQADAIKATHIDTNELFIGLTIQSSNFVTGVSGWKIDKNGNLEIYGGVVSIGAGSSGYSNLTDTPDWEHASDTTQIDGSKIHSDSLITTGSSGKFENTGTNKRVVLDSGSITFYKTFNGTEIPYKTLKRALTGTATHGDTVELGYFDTTPVIILGPYNIQCYSASNSSVNQSFKLEPINIREVDPDDIDTDEPGSNYWVFEVSAQLTLGAGQDVQSIGRTETNTNDASTITIDKNDTANMTTPTNVDEVDVSVEILSIRGTGSSGVYYNRKATLKLYIGATLEETKVITTALAGQTGFISTSINSGPLTAGSHDITVTCDFENGSGTFGSSSYEYGNTTSNSSPGETASCNANGGTAVQDYENVNFPQPTTPSGWTVYSVDYSINYSYDLNQLGGLGPGIITSAVSSSFFNISHAISYTTTSQSNTLTKSVTKSSLSSYFTLAAASGNGGYSASQGLLTTMTCNTLTVKIYYRRITSGSTTPDNRLKVVEYTYDIAAGSVISTGIAKWVATGE